MAFFGATNPHKKYDEAHSNFLKILCYIIVWGTMPFSLVKLFGCGVDLLF
jgi:hypothetical protein